LTLYLTPSFKIRPNSKELLPRRLKVLLQLRITHQSFSMRLFRFSKNGGL